MKKSFLIFTVLATFFLSSCDYKTTDSYSDQIDTYVRYTVCITRLTFDELSNTNEDSQKVLMEHLIEFDNKCHAFMADNGDVFELLQDMKAGKGNFPEYFTEFAKKLYPMIMDFIPEYSEIVMKESDDEKEIWRIVNKETNVVYTFVYSKKDESYDITLDTKSMDEYFNKLMADGKK